jgi:A/G-specific adenine glycosylase
MAGVTHVIGLKDADCRRLRRALLAWYDRGHRQMPWRAVAPQRPDPYHVLVSELMLQQTQVTTVEAYFRRFVSRFPTVQALADAPEQRVLRLWQGLGYYRRARHLHAAARQIVDRFAGRVPDEVEGLRGLPGVGRYTAGAVASIAFGRRAAAVDGNVARVLARWLAVRQIIDRPVVREQLWNLAGVLVPGSRAGDFNQALMDLGATVCLPRRPRCEACPVAGLCRAKALGRAGQLPLRRQRRSPRAVGHQVLAVISRGRVLLSRRDDRGMWAGMWHVPAAEDLPARAGADTLAKWAKELLGLAIAPPQRVGTFTHITTHRRLRVVVWRAAARRQRPRGAQWRWRQPADVDDLPLSNLARRVLAMLMAD